MANEETLQQVRDAQGNWPGVEAGTTNVTTAGTPEQLNEGTSVPIPDGARVHITATPSNSNDVYIGDSDVDQSAGVGYPLAAAQEIDISVTDVTTIWVDAMTDGDGVSWIVEVE